MLSAAAQFDTDEPTIAALAGFGLDIMHVSGSALGDERWRGKVAAGLQGAARRGVKISFDPNVRKELIGNPPISPRCSEMIGDVDDFLPSEEDVETLFPGRGLEDFAPSFSPAAREYVVLKKGEKGCEGVTRDGDTRFARTKSTFSTRPARATASARRSSR